MIRVVRYEIVNGTKSEPIPFEMLLKDEVEMEELREYLEELNHCWMEKKTITGTEKKKVKEIMITHQTI